MFINRKLGHVADFCPICRVPRPFALKRVGSAGHVYYISSGEGELVGYERTCQECGTSLQTEPTTYASICIIIYTTRPHHGRMARMGRMA